MRLRVAAALLLLTSAAACSLLRSLDDLGNGVAENEAGADGDVPTIDGGNDAANDADARPVCAPTVDLLNDPKNCGVCGYACVATDTCVEGTCAFKTMSESNEVAVGGGWLAYNDGLLVWARKIDTGEQHFQAGAAAGSFGDITTDGVHVAWTIDPGAQSGAVMACALPDCDGQRPTTIATGQAHPRGVAIGQNGRVYWAVAGGPYRCGNFARPLGGVMSAKLDGTDVRAEITAPDPANESITDVTQVFLGAEAIFWTSDVCGFDGGSSPARIWRQPVDGGAPSLVIGNLGTCHFLDLVGDETDLAFTCEYTRVASTPQTPQGGLKSWRVEADGLQFSRIATDGVRVFWTDSDSAVDGGADPDASSPGSRKVYAIDKKANPSTTKPMLLWSKSGKKNGLRGIAVDDRAIYFSDPDDRRIRALAK